MAWPEQLSFVLDQTRDVAEWHIAKFFCHAKLGRYRGHGGHRASLTPFNLAEATDYAGNRDAACHSMSNTKLRRDTGKSCLYL